MWKSLHNCADKPRKQGFILQIRLEHFLIPNIIEEQDGFIQGKWSIKGTTFECEANDRKVQRV